MNDVLLQCYVDLCEPEEIFGQPSHQSIANCRAVCTQNNRIYVEFLNLNIYKLKCSLFTDSHYIVLKLNLVNSDTGSCTKNETKNMYECLCKPNYQVMVNDRFYDYFLNIVNSNNPNQNEDTIKRERFSVLVIFFKFYPQSAVFYLAYLFEKYDVDAPLTVFRPSGRILDFRGQVVPGGVTGTVEDRGQFKDFGGKIFRKVYELILNDKCNIRTVGNQYFHKKSTITWCGIIFLYVYFFAFVFFPNL